MPSLVRFVTVLTIAVLGAVPVHAESSGTGFFDDASVARYVSPSTPYSSARYAPEGLVPVVSTKCLSVSKAGFSLRKDAAIRLSEMACAYRAAFGSKLLVVSTYRSFAKQVSIKRGGCPDSLCAKAGYSEHQSGLAVDLFEATTKREFFAKRLNARRYEWLSVNAHAFGFHNPYRNGAATDGYDPEPWHWRYLGVPLATVLRDS